MNLFFCGDIMPGGVLPYQEAYIAPSLQEYMKGFDFRIGTLEGAIGTDLPYDQVKIDGRQNIVYARNEDFFRLKEMGFDVVSLANNHIWDLGEEGLKNTIRLLKENGIEYCGAGLNIEEAARPVVLEKDGLKIAVLAYCMYGNKYLGYVELAGKDKAGVNPLDIDKVVSDVKDAKRIYDRVIVLPHWSREYRYEPLPRCVLMAEQMIRAGADAVLGSHTHQIQPIMNYKGKPVCYSMGNFLFPDFYMYPPRPIWYPDKDVDLEAIKDVVSYPSFIEEPVRRVWSDVSRYGVVIELSLKKEKDNVSIRYVRSSDDNIEELSELPEEIDKQLRKYRRLIQCWPLRILKRAKNKLLRHR